MITPHYEYDDDGDPTFPWLYYLVEDGALVKDSQHRARTERAAIGGAQHLLDVQLSHKSEGLNARVGK